MRRDGDMILGDQGAPLTGTGSRRSDQAASHLDPAGFDPLRTRADLPPLGPDAEDPTGWSKISAAAREASGLDQETLANIYNGWLSLLPEDQQNPHQFKAFLAGVALVRDAGAPASCDEHPMGEDRESGLSAQHASAVCEAETPSLLPLTKAAEQKVKELTPPDGMVYSPLSKSFVLKHSVDAELKVKELERRLEIERRSSDTWCRELLSSHAREAALVAALESIERVAGTRYFLTKCEHCGWFGTSEDCHVSHNMGDADVVCPSCDRIFLCDEIEVDDIARSALAQITEEAE